MYWIICHSFINLVKTLLKLYDGGLNMHAVWTFDTVLERVSNSIRCLFFPNQMQQGSTIPEAAQTTPGRLRTTGTQLCLFSYLKDLRNYINWRKHSELLNSPADPGLQICQQACWTIKVK